MDEEVEARVMSQPDIVAKKDVHFMDMTPNQAYSIATSMIPFLDHDDATRALMGSNMQKQGVPCILPEAPLVGTGMEDRAARDVGRMILCENDGVVDYVDSLKIIVKEEGKKKREYILATFLRSNARTAMHHRPSVNVGDKVKKGDVLADNYSSDGGRMALGQNILVAFLSWKGSNFEDAIILSEKVVKEDKYLLTELFLN